MGSIEREIVIEIQDVTICKPIAELLRHIVTVKFILLDFEKKQTDSIIIRIVIPPIVPVIIVESAVDALCQRYVTWRRRRVQDHY